MLPEKFSMSAWADASLLNEVLRELARITGKTLAAKYESAA